MHEYEIFIEDINPCGGEQYSKKTLIEAEAVSPEAYVKENGRFPVLWFSFSVPVLCGGIPPERRIC